jgi:hypothetical protein
VQIVKHPRKITLDLIVCVAQNPITKSLEHGCLFSISLRILLMYRAIYLDHQTLLQTYKINNETIDSNRR